MISLFFAEIPKIYDILILRLNVDYFIINYCLQKWKILKEIIIKLSFLQKRTMIIKN